jgi:hypothetical protein
MLPHFGHASLVGTGGFFSGWPIFRVVLQSG